MFDSIRIAGSTALGLELWAWWPVTLKIEKPSPDNNFEWIIPPYGWFFHWPPWENDCLGRDSVRRNCETEDVGSGKGRPTCDPVI